MLCVPISSSDATSAECLNKMCKHCFAYSVSGWTVDRSNIEISGFIFRPIVVACVYKLFCNQAFGSVLSIFVQLSLSQHDQSHLDDLQNSTKSTRF